MKRGTQLNANFTETRNSFKVCSQNINIAVSENELVFLREILGWAHGVRGSQPVPREGGGRARPVQTPCRCGCWVLRACVSESVCGMCVQVCARMGVCCCVS